MNDYRFKAFVTRQSWAGQLWSALACSINREERALDVKVCSRRPMGPWPSRLHLPTFALVTICLLLATGCDSRHSPIPIYGSYWSKDMSLVELRYKHPDVPVIRIPRAYIASASPYYWPNPKIIPAKGEVDALKIWLTLDTGEPLPMAESRLKSGGYLARDNYAIIDVYFGPRVEKLHIPPRPEIPANWTLPYDPDSYYRGPSSVGLISVSDCAPPSLQTSARHCRYGAQLAENLFVYASFSNLMAMGGIPFVETKLRKIKAVICSFAACID